MQERVQNILEYSKIIDQLVLRAATVTGKENADALVPFTDFEQVRGALALTDEAWSFLRRTGQSPINGFPDMRQCLKQINATLYLSAGDLLGIASCLKTARMARAAVDRDEIARLLKNLASGIITAKNIEDEILRCIIGEEEISDAASPQLSTIRKEMRRTNEKVREKLNSIIHSSDYSKYLQEPLVTIRSGRFVIPVKQEYRQQISGLIHDQSSSGATLFIEPASVVELGNQYKRLQADETEEIERILTELTALVAPYAEDIYNNLLILGDMDLAFAKAALAREMDAVMPAINQTGAIKIVKGRHPLIQRDKVVPIDVWLGTDFRTLIITGPNTGGKTVTLKTVGLFHMMMQAGMFVPAGEGTELSVFADICADIGDEQSIEQSLSTFSSHMTNIVEILKKADSGTLVLLDELGAGTDPVEGAALAMSILEELDSRGSICAATTHYSEIKAFALTHDRMENASMEFDVDKLCPTYRLFIGIPGKSNAFEISSRLGLQNGIIDKARHFLKNEDVKFEDLISSAESQRKIAMQERALAEQARKELFELRNQVEAEKLKLQQEKNKLQQKAKEDAKRIVAEAKQETEKIVLQLRTIKGIDQSAADRAIQQARDAIRQQENALNDQEASETKDHGLPPKTVKAGDTVRIITIDQKATVLSAPDSKGEVMVQAGIVKMNVKLSDIRLIKEQSSQSNSSVIRRDTTKSISFEMDIRGMMVDDAVPIVDRYIYDAKQAGLNEINIIHGKGTGALRAGIQSFIKGHPNVKSFRLGNYGEGDAGVTVITLK